MIVRKIILFTCLLLSLGTSAQTADTSFQKEWIEIDTMIVKSDLTRSALQKTNEIYQKAKQRNLPAHIIKSLIYQLKLSDRITSNDPNQAIRIIQAEINSATDETERSILYSLLAKQYQQYYNSHRWNLYNRKNTTGIVKDDIATWTNDDLQGAITGYFLRSLRYTSTLQKENTIAYSAIIIRGNSGHVFTLYDLLAFDALDYFKAGEHNITKPTNNFTIPDQALGKLNEFIKTLFPATDTSSQKWRALELYKQILSFHQKDADKKLLAELDIDRVEWVHNNITANAGNEVLYKNTLTDLITEYADLPASSQAVYLLAELAAKKARSYQPFGDTTGRYGYGIAEDLVKMALSKFTDTVTGIINLYTLLQEIRRKELRTQTEKVNIPGKPFRALVSYRNINTVYGRVIRINNNDAVRKNTGDEAYWKAVSQLKIYRTFTQNLPELTDHQLHSAEIKIDALPAGEYALLTSNNPSFSSGQDKMSIQFFHVSNISYIKNKGDFFVLNRENGKPIQNAEVTIYKYDYRAGDQKVADKITDANGYFSFDIDRYMVAQTYRYDIRKGNDRLYLKENDYIFDNNVDEDDISRAQLEKLNSRVFFFTDRSIYRPGQTVLFKGISLTRDQKTNLSKLLILKDSAWVYLSDVNQKKVDSAKFAVNSYGSFNGSFRLPQNGLTGNFSISVAKPYNSSNTYFSVEEYKRPTFSVSFEKTKGEYRLRDSVIISGTAKGYAGNNISNAKVSYRVIRNTRFMYPFVNRGFFPSTANREIQHGEITTDADGKFRVRFKAMADDITSVDSNSVFDFTVTADITDGNGETRSNNSNIPVGYTSLQLKVIVPAITEVDSLKKITIYTTNPGDQKEPSVIAVMIYSLAAPEKLFKKRYWQRPDLFVMNRKEFATYFPADEFEEESNYQTWPTGALVMEGSVNTKDKEYFAVGAGTLKPGYYRVETFTKDKYGLQVKNSQYMQLFDRNTPTIPFSQYQFSYTAKATVQPGDTAYFISGSAARQIHLIRKIDRPQDKSDTYEFIDRKSGNETIEYLVTEKDRDGTFISEAFVFENRIYTQQYRVNVPWTNKMLQVQYASYRDKTEPGNKERWTVTVQTDKNEKAAAELLTGMYDASLDQFKPHNWPVPATFPNNPSKTIFTGYTNFIAESGIENYVPESPIPYMVFQYDHIAIEDELWIKSIEKLLAKPSFISEELRKQIKDDSPVIYSMKTVSGITTSLESQASGIRIRGAAPKNFEGTQNLNDVVKVGFGDEALENIPVSQPVIRKNFNETAFFFPQLYADSSGKYSFSFIMPDALTQWKWMTIAHTKDLSFGSSTATIITQKKLMVQSNAPRFMREGDNMEFSTKISNLDEKEITGQVSFELIDPVTNTSVDGWFQNVFPSQYFTVAAGQSFTVKFPIQIPFNYNRPLNWRIVARSGNMSDGEENTLPVLTNRVLVTETLPLLLQNDTIQHFSFDKLLKNTSESLTQQGLTVEYTTNPVWYAVQALPYLMEYPYDCAEQTFNRFYANTLAAYIVNKQPLIKQVFEQWRKDTSSLKSNLQKNEELKQVLLQETPWVLQAESEAVQKNNLAMLFDMARLNTQTNTFIEKLTQQQLPNGAFPWFKGGNEDRYITNYILTGIGKLKRLGALTPDVAMRIRTLLGNAMKYMDGKIASDYNDLLKHKADTNLQQVFSTQIDYLYMRSFFGDIAQTSPAAWQYFYKQGKQFWIKQNSYYKAQMGLIAFRNKDDKFAVNTILPALLENTVTDTKLGMYWKTTYAGWWYQSPIEHQSMMIAFFSEIEKDQKSQPLTKQLNAMKTWLLLNKQTNNWRTTIATADACYALLLNGSDWLSNSKTVNIQLGNTAINSTDEKTAPATGYFKKRIDARFVNSKMGDITVTTQSATRQTANTQQQQPSWGSIYWQYFENMDKVTTAGGPLSITKKLFIERNTDKGKRLDAIKENEELQVGDKVVIRMELRSDRDMDYLHLKDSRAASMEPVNVLSGYKWQDGLGYYESTKDASSNFFISHLAKGTYVFEYPVFISHSGVFSAGIATIQCMYAPEFTSHSQGIKVRVGQ